MDVLERVSFDAHIQKRGDRKGLGVPSGKAGLGQRAKLRGKGESKGAMTKHQMTLMQHSVRSHEIQALQNGVCRAVDPCASFLGVSSHAIKVFHRGSHVPESQVQSPGCFLWYQLL